MSNDAMQVSWLLADAALTHFFETIIIRNFPLHLLVFNFQAITKAWAH